MRRSLRWWWDRLRAMSPGEVATRAFRLARHPVEVAAMRAGRYPAIPRDVRAYLARWTGPHVFYFSGELARAPISTELRADADAICSGERRVLGLGWRRLPDPPWDLEPLAMERWPIGDAARVIAAAPAHLDPRLTWEMNRGHEWVTLARVFAATGDARYRQHLAAELASWRDHNPIGLGINWASPMEAAIRMHSLAWVAGLMRGDPVMPGVAAMLYGHAAFVADRLSLGSSANNHLIVELSALAVASRVLEEAGLLARRLGWLDRLDEEVERQVFPDGVNAEMATHYHAFVLEALLLVTHLERAHAAPRFDLERACAMMADYLAAIRIPGGVVLRQGDDDDGVIVSLLATDHARQLVAAAQCLDQPGAQMPSSSAVDGAALLAGGRLLAISEQRESRRFAESGQIILRSDRAVVTFDAGPFGFGTLAAHAHCDCLSVAVAFDGVPVVVERGTYRYNGDPDGRDRYRLTAAHNTLQLGTQEQATAAGPFLWGRRPNVRLLRCDLATEDLVVADHDGFAAGTHQRAVLRRGDHLAIADRATARNVSGTARLHLAPELHAVAVATSRGNAFAIHERATDRRVAWVWTMAPAEIVASRHSSHYASEVTAQTIAYGVPPGAGVELACVIGPAPLPDPARFAAVASAALSG